MKDALKHKTLFLSCLSLLVSAAVGTGIVLNNTNAYASIDSETPTANIQKSAEPFAILSGFEPHADVQYAVMKLDGSARSGSSKTDEQGNLSLNLGQDISEATQDFKYHFVVEGAQNVHSFSVIRDPESGQLNLKGNGFGELSDIEIKVNEHLINTRTDWAGLFEASGIKVTESPSNPSNVKVAFYGANPIHDLAKQPNPATVEIQVAPGGGGPGKSGTITYLPIYCYVDPVPSFCYVLQVAQHMQNIVKNLIYPMQVMTDQLAATSMNAIGQIGRFFDAKEQLEVQRDFQVLKARAHKDYHTSDQMCRVGSFMKSLNAAQEKSKYDALAINKIMTDRAQNKANFASSYGPGRDGAARLKQFREVYCDPNDNGGTLYFLCEHDQDDTMANSDLRDPRMTGIGAENIARINKDIDVYRTLEYPMTLDINFAEKTGTDDEEDIAALAKNLYWPSAMKKINGRDLIRKSRSFIKARHLMALNGIAHNSFTKIVGMKAAMPDPASPSILPGWSHMKTMMREFGLSDEAIADYLGRNPSYHAQMDVLTKKLYQNPDFYTNLYDKPGNVDRINASLQAIELMQMRDHYEGMLRREMLSSAMIKEAMAPSLEELQARMRDLE